MFRIRTTDDRGKPTKLYRTGILPIRAPGEHPVDRNEWARARRDVYSMGMTQAPGLRESFSRSALIRMLPIALGPGAAGLVALLITQATGAFSGGMLIIALPLMGVYMVFIVWKRRCGFFEFRPRVIIKAMLRQRLCPACGYSLRLVPVGPDACRVCPECGGAWKV